MCMLHIDKAGNLFIANPQLDSAKAPVVSAYIGFREVLFLSSFNVQHTERTFFRTLCSTCRAGITVDLLELCESITYHANLCSKCSSRRLNRKTADFELPG